VFIGSPQTDHTAHSIPAPGATLRGIEAGALLAGPENLRGLLSVHRPFSEATLRWLMAGESAAGFWSYTHGDNQAEGGRIRQLAADLMEAYELRTAEPLELFVDSMSIRWGDDWEEKINEALAGTVFFIPIITPRFFRSQECRRELLKFAREAKRLGVDELLLPVYYVDVPDLEDSSVEDEAMTVVRPKQREDFRGVRLEDPGSSDYRKAVDHLAAQLAERAERVTHTTVDVRQDDEGAKNEENGDEPGFIERMAKGEQSFQHISETLEEFAKEVERFGTLAQQANEESQATDARGAGFAGRLAVVERLAKRLREPADRIGHLGQVYASELVQSDPMVLALLEAIETEYEEYSQEERTEATALAKSIEDLAAEAAPALAELSDLVDALDSGAGLSRSLRRPLRRAKEGLQGVLDGKGVIEEWARRASQLNVRSLPSSNASNGSSNGTEADGDKGAS
jgi:hypothetical protein